MQAAITELEHDPRTGVLVLTGAGESWCAGQDLKEYFRALDDDPVGRARARKASHDWTWERLRLFPKPTIAMVNGYCFGGAFTPGRLRLRDRRRGRDFRAERGELGHLPGRTGQSRGG